MGGQTIALDFVAEKIVNVTVFTFMLVKKNVTDAMFPSDYKRTTIRKKKTTKEKNILHLV